MALAGGSWVGAAAAELSGRAAATRAFVGTHGRGQAMVDGANSRVVRHPFVPTSEGGGDATRAVGDARGRKFCCCGGRCAKQLLSDRSYFDGTEGADGGRATRRDKEDKVPMRLPVAVALHSPPRQGRGDRLKSSYVEEEVFTFVIHN